MTTLTPILFGIAALNFAISLYVQARAWRNWRAARKAKEREEANSDRPYVYKLDAEQAALFKAAMAPDADDRARDALAQALKRAPKGSN